MTRLKNTTENQLITRLKKLLENATTIKRRQFVGGSSLVLNKVATNNTWDVVATVTGFSQDATWRVTWTPSTSKVGYTQLEFNYSVSSGVGTVIAYDDPSDTTSSTQKSYIVGLIPNPNLDNVTLSLKFAIRSTTSGSFSWTRLT